MKVFKWHVRVDDEFHEIGGGKVLHVQSQHGHPDVVQVWTEEPENSEFRRKATVIGTGHEVPKHTKHVGSTVVRNGLFVWHVYATDRTEVF